MLFSTAVVLLSAWSSAEASLHARVSYDGGGTLVRGLDDGDWSHAAVNSMILPGDALWADQGTWTEIEMEGGSFLRLADGSRGELVTLPPDGTIRAWTGSFYLHRVARSTGGVIVETPACVIQVEQGTVVRIDVVGEGNTTISVQSGQVRVSTDPGGSKLVGSSYRCYVDVGRLPSQPILFDRYAEDSFDRWNRDRVAYLEVGETALPSSISFTNATLGVSDLSASGEWVVIDQRTYWRPTVVVDYTPYRYGAWTFVPQVGHVWVGNYPFEYVTGHYGRWTYRTPYGWVWSYDPVWSPAWVATVRCGSRYVWTPIDYDYRPVRVYGSTTFSVGGVLFSVSGTSYVDADYLYTGGTYVHPVTYGTVGPIFADEVHIWNINLGDSHHDRVPYDRRRLGVRDYAPSRSIRGPQQYDKSRGTANDRARRLEATNTGLFPDGRRIPARSVRTASVAKDRQAVVRPVRSTATPSVSPISEHRSIDRGQKQALSPRVTDRSVSSPSRERSTTVRGPVSTPVKSRSDRSTFPGRVESERTQSSRLTTPSATRQVAPSRPVVREREPITRVPSSSSRVDPRQAAKDALPSRTRTPVALVSPTPTPEHKTLSGLAPNARGIGVRAPAPSPVESQNISKGRDTGRPVIGERVPRRTPTTPNPGISRSSRSSGRLR